MDDEIVFSQEKTMKRITSVHSQVFIINLNFIDIQLCNLTFCLLFETVHSLVVGERQPPLHKISKRPFSSAEGDDVL